MSVFFLGRIVESVGYEKLPPSVMASSWFATTVSTIMSQGELNPEYIKISFDNETDLENWIRANQLTDPALINDVKEYNRQYNVVHINEIHHEDGTVTATNLSLIPLE